MKISLSRFWSRSEGGFASFMAILNAAATFMVFLIMLMVTADVFGRGFFNSPVMGTAEIVRNLVVVICFLQIGHVLRQNRHIRSTLIVQRLPPLGTELVQILTSAVGLALFVMLFKGGWGLNWTAWVIHEYEGEGALNVPTYPVRTIILLGAVLMSIQFALNLCRSVRAAVGMVRRRAD